MMRISRRRRITHTALNIIYALTTKKIAWKAVVPELLWFLEGSNDERRLAEILYNDKRENLNNK